MAIDGKPAAPVYVDFNDISRISHNESIVYVKNKELIPGSAIKMKDGDKFYVYDTPQEVNEKIQQQREANEAKLKSLGIRLVL